MLAVEQLSAGYGDIVAVRDFSFSVERGKTMALLGANGAGKSSIFAAVTFSLYGKTRGDIDSVIKTGKAFCKVKLYFESDDNIRYCIIRKRSINKGSSLIIKAIDNESLSITRPTIVETQSVIENIIGINYDLFMSSVYFGQERITNFMQKSPKERKELFTDMLGLGIYKLAEVKVKEKISALTLELNKKEMDYTHYSESITTAREAVATLHYDDKEKERLEMEINILDDRIRSLCEMIKHKETAYNQYNTVCELVNDKNDNELNISELNQNIKEANKAILVIKEKLDRAENKQVFIDKIDKLERTGNICSKCGSVIKSDKVKYSIEAAKEVIRTIEKYETKQQGLYYNLQRYQKDVSSTQTRQSSIVDKLNKYNIDLEKLSKDTLLKELKQAQKELDTVEEQKSLLKQKVLKMIQSKTLMEDKMKTINNHQKYAIQINVYINKLRLINQEYNLLAHAFSRNGIPSYILENTLPELERTTNDILSTIMKEPFYIKFKVQKKTKSDKVKDTFDLSIFVNNVERQFNSCSGGEKVRVSIAIRLAISKLLSQSTGTKISFLLIDEIEYLDSAGLESFVDIINSIKNEFDTILIISHLAKLKNIISNHIVIEKGIDSSKILGG